MEPLAAGDPRQVGVYRLRARLGAGGMGRVFLGFSPGGRAVAVKVVHPELARDPEFVRRFGREVRAAEAVGGVYTAPVVAHGLDDDPPWIATVFIAGPTLADVVEVSGPLSEQAVRRLVGGLAEALQAIHARGLVHRDLKPANVLLAADGPRVIDFGISRALEGTVLTGTSVVMGTPGFMSPEQVTGQPAGPASDIFALGSVLTFAASGRVPFAAGEAVAMAYQIVHAEPDLSGVPDGLLQLVMACLVKDPARRPGLADIIATIGAAGAGAGSSASFWPPPVSGLVNSWQDRLGLAGQTPEPAPGPVMPAVSGSAEPTRTGIRGAAMAVGRPGPARPAGPRRRTALAITAAVLITAAFAAAAGIAIALSGHGPAVAATTGARTPATSAPGISTRSAPASTATRMQGTSARSPASASAAPSASQVAAPASAAPGQISPGTEQCGLSTTDGHYQVYALAEHVAGCSEVSRVLASFGVYWYPLSSATIAQDQVNGVLMDVNSYCHLSATSGVNLSIYADPQVAGSSTDHLAQHICVSEETNGWTPHVSTQG